MPFSNSQKNQAAAELLFAGVLWGFGFVATVWLLTALQPLGVTGWRFSTAAVFGWAFCFLRPNLRSDFRSLRFWVEQFKISIIPGLLLSGLMVFQTWGLKYTSATKSSFITTLYVLIVPLLERFWMKRRLPKSHIFAVAIAFVGTALICNLVGELSTGNSTTDSLNRMSLNLGDFLTLLCAILASVHIIWVGRIQDEITDPFVFNCFQSFWAGIAPLLLSFALEPPPIINASQNAWIGFLTLAFGCTLIAFTLQVRAQRVLSPSVASLLFLLESPFATVFALLLLNESLKSHQWLGGGLILLSAGFSTFMATQPGAAPVEL
jgi:drug/metabolite transporter (DMT)-like permease